MGLIEAAVNSVTGTLADQYREYFYCEALSSDVLAIRGKKRSGRHSVNRRDNNIITTGSVIAIADGQCMMIVEQGRVVEVCAQTGHYVYDASTEPSLFAGDLSESVREFLENIARRWSFGGQAAKDQRVYYFNTKEITGNKYGTPNPVPFRVVDQRAGIDLDISIRCFGEYSYRITNPMLFYTKVCGNVTDAYTRDQLDGQLKSELLTALQPAFARISEMGIRYSALPGHTIEFSQALNDALSDRWRDTRGIEIASVGVSSVKASEEDEAMIRELQKNAAFMDPARAAAHLVGAQAAAMQAAASNPNAGSAAAFMGMNMASQAGGFNAQSFYQTGQVNAAVQQSAPSRSGQNWTCPKCGQSAIGNFCPQCGEKRPATDNWICPVCGKQNQSNFCSECGAKKPAAASCTRCGWIPADPSCPPKFCPECGSAFS